MATYKGLQVFVQETDSEHRGYFEAARRGELVVQHCLSCGMLRGSVGAACPFCMSLEWDWQQVSGKGVINDSIHRPNILYRILLGILPF